MLSWTQRPDGWHSNGYRIELVEPFRWLLLESDRDRPQVGAEQQPLAVSRSLTECKREAELLVAARERAELRRRHVTTLLLVLASAALLVGNPANPLVIFGALLLAVRSVSVLLGTLLPGSFGPQHEVFYQ